MKKTILLSGIVCMLFIINSYSCSVTVQSDSLEKKSIVLNNLLQETGKTVLNNPYNELQDEIEEKTKTFGNQIEITGKDLVGKECWIILVATFVNNAVYKWSIITGEEKVELLATQNDNERNVTGKEISGELNDVTVAVEVFVNGEPFGYDTHDLTVFSLSIKKPQDNEKVFFQRNGYSGRIRSQLRINIEAEVEPNIEDLKTKIKPYLKWSIDDIDDSHSNPNSGNVLIDWNPSLDATHGKDFETRVRFRGVPPKNSDFGGKYITLELVEHSYKKKIRVWVFYYPLIRMKIERQTVAAWYYYFSADGRPDNDPGVCTFTRTNINAQTYAQYIRGNANSPRGRYLPKMNLVVLYDNVINDFVAQWNGGGVSFNYNLYSGDAVEHGFWHENWHRWHFLHLTVYEALLSSNVRVNAKKLQIINGGDLREFPIRGGTIFIDGDEISYGVRIGRWFIRIPTDGDGRVNTEHAARSLVTSRADFPDVTWDWNDGSNGGDADNDRIDNNIDPDNDDDFLPDQFEIMLTTNHGLSFDINDKHSDSYNGFPISFDPNAGKGGDYEVFVEWRLSNNRIPDFTNTRNWQGILKTPNQAPNRVNDWSKDGFNWRQL